MAIQVSGTTVISDTKELQGLTGIDQTSVDALFADGIQKRGTQVDSGNQTTGTIQNRTDSGALTVYTVNITESQTLTGSLSYVSLTGAITNGYIGAAINVFLNGTAIATEMGSFASSVSTLQSSIAGQSPRTIDPVSVQNGDTLTVRAWNHPTLQNYGYYNMTFKLQYTLSYT